MLWLGLMDQAPHVGAAHFTNCSLSQACVKHIVGTWTVRLLSGGTIAILVVAVLIWPADILVAKVGMTLASSTVQGTILSNRVEASFPPSGGSGTYRTAISYEYLVDDQRFTGTRLAPGMLNWVFSPDSDEVGRLYPAGAAVTVYYNPRHPEFAFIKRAYLMLSLGLSQIGIGLAVLGSLKQFRPNWSRPRWLVALLYALFPAGVVTAFTMPQYVDASWLMNKSLPNYGGLWAAIYLFLLITRRRQS